MKSVVRFALALVGTLVLLRASAAEKLPLRHAMMGVANGCFVETVAFLDQWQEAKGSDAWARLLQWGAREDEEIVAGHAVAICEANGTLWSWDINFGWTKLTADAAQREKPELVSPFVLKKYPRVTARYPTYRHDFPQSPAAAPPTAQFAHENQSLRDASIVGERLAKRRPVNVVRFTHGAEDGKKESGAAVFVFHGRYCVYVPEMGTLPFRVRGDVANLRLIQELLRRIFPGVSGVRKLQGS